MGKIETTQQKLRRQRNEFILDEYSKTFKDGDSITEWCKNIAKKKRVSYSTVYALILKNK